MRIAENNTLSTVPKGAGIQRQRKPSHQSYQTLEFIHRFRHVTTRHLQLTLGHTHVATSLKQLTHLINLGYCARQYEEIDRASNRPASYYLTTKGLELLREHNPEGRYRLQRSVGLDARLSLPTRERYHALATVYVHFKRHYDGHFAFATAFDYAQLDYVPDEVPDGYVRLKLPGLPVQHYFVEIYGWGRSSQVQRRRLYGYVHYAESGHWPVVADERQPGLFIVAGSLKSQKRLDNHMAIAINESLADDFRVFTSIANRLDNEEPTIWRQVTAD